MGSPRGTSSTLPTSTHGRARRFKALYARYQRNRDLITVGAYTPGNDPTLDEAVSLHSAMESFLQQDMRERAGMAESSARLAALLAGNLAHA